MKGLSVMQIGCDPKHDSTRQLIGGKKQTTVLDYVRTTPPSKRSLNDVVIIGSEGIRCVEAGGPEPGVGCAGRGILTMFDTLKNLGIDELDSDITVYDVLGDVVCGGFAVPMRSEHTDAIYIVTSGEFMSIYAANNILRGLLNFGSYPPRVAGLVFNERGSMEERDRVESFSIATGLPIISDIPRSEKFMEAEKSGITVSERFPNSEITSIYRSLADDVVLVSENKRPLYPPKPLSEDQLDDLLSGRPIDDNAITERDPVCDGPLILGMGSCASRGAAFMAGRIMDLPIIIHGPDSCGYVMSHTQDSHYLSDIDTNRFIKPMMRNNVVCTGMGEHSSIFGGTTDLKGTLRKIMDSGKRDAMVITTCVSGMIGDDVDHAVANVSAEYDGCRIDVIHADGNLTGDSEEGREAVMNALFSRIDTSVEPEGSGVNLVDDTFIWFNRGFNDRWTEELITGFGLELETKIFEECSLEKIRMCRRNPFSILVEDTERNNAISKKLSSILTGTFLPPLPKGYGETVEWCREIGMILHKEEIAENMIRSMKAEYESDVTHARRFLIGKCVNFIVNSVTDVDWMIEALMDAGAIIGVVEIMNVKSSGVAFSRYKGKVEFRDAYSNHGSRCNHPNEIPDLTIGHMIGRLPLGPTMNIPKSRIGYKASGLFLKTAINILITGGREGWRAWRDWE